MKCRQLNQGQQKKRYETFIPPKKKTQRLTTDPNSEVPRWPTWVLLLKPQACEGTHDCGKVRSMVAYDIMVYYHSLGILQVQACWTSASSSRSFLQLAHLGWSNPASCNIALPSGFSLSAIEGPWKEATIVSAVSDQSTSFMEYSWMHGSFPKALASDWVRYGRRSNSFCVAFWAGCPPAAFSKELRSVGRGTSNYINYSPNIYLHLLNIPNSTWILWLWR